MAEQHNTVVCFFDPSSPRITAYEIHEWIHAALGVQESKVSMIKIDGISDKFSLNLWITNPCMPCFETCPVMLNTNTPTGSYQL